MKSFSILLLVMGGALVATADDVDGSLRMNQIQVIATHNSYHVAPPPAMMKILIAADERMKEWDYTHAPLATQLDRGVRGFELDVYWQEAGFFKTMHVPVYDTGSHCERFTDCLKQIKAWSDANPNHVPIITHIEVKDEQYDQVPAKILPVGKLEIDALDAEIHSVFDAPSIFTPDDLRGDFASPNEAATSGGWPKLDDVRGQCVFILHNRGTHRAAYLEENPISKGRAMFNFGMPGEPDTAFLIRDNPGAEDVKEMAAAGYMIRTRAGGPGDTARLQQAIESGAHLISTDNPPGEPDEATGYVVEFEDGKTIRRNAVAK